MWNKKDMSPDERAQFLLDLLEQETLPIEPTAIAHSLNVAVEGDACLNSSGNYTPSDKQAKQPAKIVYNAKEYVYRQRFTIAHELGHHILDHGPCPRADISYKNNDPKETAANAFAAALLMPADMVKTCRENNPEMTLADLSDKFHVSTTAMTYRLENLKIPCEPVHIPSQKFSGEYQLAFSPGNEALSLLSQFIDNAKKTIHIAAYVFTKHSIAEKLKKARERAVDVRVVLNAVMPNEDRSPDYVLCEYDIPCRISRRDTTCHHKFMVIDGTHVQTGSFNYTGSAPANSENVLVLLNVPDLAGRYEAEWERLWNGGEAQPASHGGELTESDPFGCAHQCRSRG